MMMDDALTGPGLGVRVGEPIGEATGGYGNVREYTMPYSHVYFQVSTEYIPPVRGQVVQTLMPQIPVGLSSRDIRLGIDPFSAWLATLGEGRGK